MPSPDMPDCNTVNQAAPIVALGFHACNIRKVANGFIVQIGCKEFVAKNWEEASTGLGMYWKDPRAAEKKYTD